MNRRAKLSLASSRDITKKQIPPGFEGIEAPPEAERAQAGPTAVSPPRPVAMEAGADSGARGGPRTKTAAASPTIGSKQLIKAMVVLVATALSLYLLKRRFF